MSCKDKGQTWKYFTGLTAAVLLIHVCVVETIDFQETSIKFQFSHTDESQHHIQKRDADVDECVQIPAVCGPNSICNNTDGSYECWCVSGYNVTDPNLPINITNPCRATGPFYPFGTGDTESEGGSAVIHLLQPFTFFGLTYNQIYVNNNGYLTFKPIWYIYFPYRFPNGGKDIIAPFWTYINLFNGVISYRQYTSGSVLTQATQDINQYFPDLSFSASWVFVATWDRVGYYHYLNTDEASFQVVLISNGNFSFVLMNYGAIAPLALPVQPGYDTIDSSHYFSITKSLDYWTNLTYSSNVNVSGRWAFRTDLGSRCLFNGTGLFYPFGTGDTEKEGDSAMIHLFQPFTFFGLTYNQIYVNNNGFLTFNGAWYSNYPNSFPAYGGKDIIAPLWAGDSLSGNISYRQYTSGSVLTQATQDINQYFPDLNFSASWVFVATWDRVWNVYYQNTETSFQVVLISNGSFSFVLMNYGAIAISQQSIRAGYDTINSTYYFSITKPQQNYSTSLACSSNVNVSGRWAFRTDLGSQGCQFKDLDEYQVNSSLCGANSNCTHVNGGYSCSCLKGFTATFPNLTISINNTCTDINECLNSSSVCGPNSYCQNYNGSYSCSCLRGYNVTKMNETVSNSNQCTDVDECVEIPAVCGPNSICNNTAGSYNCSCMNGYNITNPNLHINISNPCTEAPSKTTVKPPTTTQLTVMTMSMRINQNFDTSLTNKADPKYISYVKIITSAIENSYMNLPNYITGSANVFGFRSGSIIADYTINANTNNLDVSSVNTQVSDLLAAQGIPLAKDAFAESEEKNLTTKDKVYPLQDVELRCTRPNSVVGTMKWSVNDKDPAENSAKYTITNDGLNSTLIVKGASESDNGRYLCIIERSTLPYIQWQTVSIEPRPNIIVDKPNIKLQCQDQILPLTCCADGYTVEWFGIPADDEVENSGSGCVTLQYKSTTCGSKDDFTCRLKDMPELKIFDYSNRTVYVQTVREYNCINDTLGVGKIGDTVTGLCEKGLEGYITYECKQTTDLEYNWTEVKRNCVVQPIKDLERRSEVLFVEEIPVFMTDLSNTAVQNNTAITQSADTVKTIVNILNTIAVISQNITISQPVMEDFLKTVDIIVSDASKNTWIELNNDNKTKNKSTELLKAIETISDRLSDNDFMIKETSIQLNRTTIRSSFIGSSSLPNSTTQIVIPSVLKPTLITTIIFTKLDNVLPTRNTSNNDKKTSENHINGDVVVVKVNKTINNISFAFDTTNTSLTNPQCVFWNFDLDHWDSIGCKLKGTGNKTVTCECSHTTSFSILMSPFAIDNPALAYITYIGVAISLASLVLCLIIEAIVWKSVTGNDTSYMRNVSIVNVAVSLLIADICFIIAAAIGNPGQPTPVNPCSAVVFFMHFFYLAVFFWMFILALLLLYLTVIVFSHMSRANMMVIAFTVGYCAPLLIAVITVASTAGPKNYVSKENACWLNWFESKALLAFVIPALTIVAFNILVLIVVVYTLLRKVGAQSEMKHAVVVIARCVAFLTPIFGLTWGFGIGTMMSSNFGIHVVFAILNSLQGFFVLVFGTLLDRTVRESLSGKLSLNSLTRPKSTSAETVSNKLGVFQRKQRKNVYNTSDHSAASPSNRFSASDS